MACWPVVEVLHLTFLLYISSTIESPSFLSSCRCESLVRAISLLRRREFVVVCLAPRQGPFVANAHHVAQDPHLHLHARAHYHCVDTWIEAPDPTPPPT